MFYVKFSWDWAINSSTQKVQFFSLPPSIILYNLLKLASMNVIFPGDFFEKSVLELVMSNVPLLYTTPWSVKLCLECSLPPATPVHILPSKEVTSQEILEDWQDWQVKHNVLPPKT